MRYVTSAAAAIVLTGVLSSHRFVVAQAPSETAADWVGRFSEGWDETAWEQEFRGIPDGYMRRDDDAGWKSRMLALQGLVRLRGEALPELHQLLESGDGPQRILAAQTLGYIAAAESREPLLTAARTDEIAAVRLYAVDSLGMLGGAAGEVDWKALADNESAGDVKKHINYAIERDGTAVEPAVVERLTRWDPALIDSVAIGKAAPDFELRSAQGETVRLSDYRGEKAVVLVFIYGDT